MKLNKQMDIGTVYLILTIVAVCIGFLLRQESNAKVHKIESAASALIHKTETDARMLISDAILEKVVDIQSNHETRIRENEMFRARAEPQMTSGPAWSGDSDSQ